MSPEAEIALAALAFTVFCALAGLIWRAATQHAKVTHLEAAYVAIHRRLDELEKTVQDGLKSLELAMARAGLDAAPPPSPRSRVPLPPG